MRFSVLLLTGLQCCSLSLAQVDHRSLELDLRTQRRAEIQQEFMDQLNRSTLRKHEALLSSTMDVLALLHTDAKALIERVDVLRTSPEGQSLTSSPDAVRGIAELLDKPPVDLATVEANLTSVREELTATRRLIDEPQVGFVPDDQKLQDVLLTQDWGKRHLTNVRERLSWLDSALRAAANSPANAASLNDAIADYRAEEVAMLARLREKARREVRAEADEHVVQAARVAELEHSKAAAELLLRETREALERQRLDFDAAMKQLEVSAQTAWTRREIEYQTTIADLSRELQRATDAVRLREAQTQIDGVRAAEKVKNLHLKERCKDPDVQALLAPFLAKGYTQPGNNVPEAALRPISYSKLRSTGALENGDLGLSRLIRVASWRGDTQRPRWPYPENISAIEKRFKGGLAKVTEAQRLLIELGDTLVELEMLEP